MTINVADSEVALPNDRASESDKSSITMIAVLGLLSGSLLAGFLYSPIGRWEPSGEQVTTLPKYVRRESYKRSVLPTTYPPPTQQSWRGPS